jgi:hypothetical protein
MDQVIERLIRAVGCLRREDSYLIGCDDISIGARSAGTR